MVGLGVHAVSRVAEAKQWQWQKRGSWHGSCQGVLGVCDVGAFWEANGVTDLVWVFG